MKNKYPLGLTKKEWTKLSENEKHLYTEISKFSDLEIKLFLSLISPKNKLMKKYRAIKKYGV